jgi:hypothetical protein
MKKIIIEPKNPLDVKPKDVQELAEEIRSFYPNYKVVIEGKGYSGYAVTWWEVVNIWVIAPISGLPIEQIVKLSIKWARQRFTKEGKEKRPKSITIYGPKGDILKSIVLKNVIDEPDVTTPLKEEKRYRLKPPFENKPFFEPYGVDFSSRDDLKTRF